MNSQPTSMADDGGPPTADPSANSATGLSAARRRKLFRLLAVLLAVIPFALVEATLLVLGIADPADADDPLSGFNAAGRLFEKDERDEVYRTAAARGLFFGDQEFALEKPRDGYRVFCLGGSTVRGRPFTTESSFTRWIGLELAERTEGKRTVEAVNCGGLSYASFRLRPIVKEVLEYAPDLIVIATGHNEFLEDRSYRGIKDRNAAWAWIEDHAMSLRSVTLCRRWLESSDSSPRRTDEKPSEVETRLDQQSGYASYERDLEWQSEVVAKYRESLEVMISACREANVPVILVRLGCNLRDCPPFKSQHRDMLDGALLTRWQKAMDRGAALTSERRFDEAVVAFREAEKIDDQHALVAWRIARTLDRLGLFQEAAVAYRKARDLDVCPLRMIEQLDKTLQEVASATGTPLVDAAASIESKSPAGIPGSDWYVDHVHPTLGGHQEIARLVVEQINRQGWVALSRPLNPARLRRHRRRQFRRLGPVFLANGARRVEWLENWARRQKLDDEVVPVSSHEYARDGFRSISFGRDKDAWESYAQSLAIAPTHGDTSPVITIVRHAEQLFWLGRTDDARDLIDHLGELPEVARGGLAPLWSHAALVIAVERGDRQAVGRLLRQYGSLLEAVELPDDAPFARVMPDVLKRSRRLAGVGDGR